MVEKAITRTTTAAPQAFYDIVKDIGRYPEFVPGISHSEVRRSRVVASRPTGHRVLHQLGILHVQAAVPFKYESRVTLNERINGLECYKITATSERTTFFKSLTAEWTICPETSLLSASNSEHLSAIEFDELFRRYLASSESALSKTLVRYDMKLETSFGIGQQLISGYLTDSVVEAFVNRLQ